MPSLDTAMSYHRLKRAPLDDMEVFSDLRSLMDYCKDGARYDGQRVVVLNDTLGSVEYSIKNNIPIIDMKGSEPIFKSITFKGDSSASHGLLIYENNMSGLWNQNEIFTFNEGRFCLLNQLEIFRILDASSNKSFKFYIERQTRNTDTVYTATWTQNFNPYIDASGNSISTSAGAAISAMVFGSTTNGWLKTNNSDIVLMPRTQAGITQEDKYITKIYIKAEDYYQALI